MAFWIFMMIMLLLIPVTMIGFGRRFKRKAPKEINYVFGYRTSASMKNQDTWEFAHHYCGRIWYVAGWIMLAVNIASMLLVWGKGEGDVGMFGMVLEGIQIVCLLGTIFPVEKALKRNFDEAGNRRRRMG